MPMVSAWGSTETSPLATDCHFPGTTSASGTIGVPISRAPELKLEPSGRQSWRVRLCRGPERHARLLEAPN
jgi:feruloyl-CoA synthase